MFCRDCGAKNPDNALFCSRCGAAVWIDHDRKAANASLRVEEAFGESIGMKCPSCGKSSWNAAVCPFCNAQMPKINQKMIEKMLSAARGKGDSTIESVSFKVVKDGVVIDERKVTKVKCLQCGTMNQDRAYCSKCGWKLMKPDDFPPVNIRPVNSPSPSAKSVTTRRLKATSVSIGMGRKRAPSKVPQPKPMARYTFNNKSKPDEFAQFRESEKNYKLWVLIIAVAVVITFALIMMLE